MDGIQDSAASSHEERKTKRGQWTSLVLAAVVFISLWVPPPPLHHFNPDIGMTLTCFHPHTLNILTERKKKLFDASAYATVMSVYLCFFIVFINCIYII